MASFPFFALFPFPLKEEEGPDDKQEEEEEGEEEAILVTNIIRASVLTPASFMVIKLLSSSRPENSKC